MRTFAATLFSVLVFSIGLSSSPVFAQNGVVTFKFVNEARYIIYLKFFAQNRSWVWPSDNMHYLADDSTERAARLACNVGEKICFGGAYRPDGTGTYWGLGYRGNQSCTNCCLICGTMNDDVSHTWRLTE